MQQILYLRQLLKCDHDRIQNFYFARLLSLLLKPRELLVGARAVLSLKQNNNFYLKSLNFLNNHYFLLKHGFWFLRKSC